MAIRSTLLSKSIISWIKSSISILWDFRYVVRCLYDCSSRGLMDHRTIWLDHGRTRTASSRISYRMFLSPSVRTSSRTTLTILRSAGKATSFSSFRSRSLPLPLPPYVNHTQRLTSYPLTRSVGPRCNTRLSSERLSAYGFSGRPILKYLRNARHGPQQY